MLLLSGTNHCIGQSKLSNESPYNLAWKVDAPILTIGIGLTISQIIIRNKTDLSSNYIQQLDPNSINKFDRSAVFNFSTKADKASDFLLYTSMSVPLLLLADKKMRQDWKRIAVISSESFVVGLSLTLLTKNISKRARPFLYNTNLPLTERIGPDGKNSFFSGHTSMTTLSCFLMAKLIVDYHPDTKFKPLIWTLATSIPLTTGFLRYEAGKHFFTDVLTGFAVGALSGYFVPYLHQTIEQRRASKKKGVLHLDELDVYNTK